MQKITKNWPRIAIIVCGLLLIPLILTFRDSGSGGGWNWGPLDFVIMGALFFLTGVALDYVRQKVRTPLGKLLAMAGILLTLLLIWVELAVDGVTQAITWLIAL